MVEGKCKNKLSFKVKLNTSPRRILITHLNALKKRKSCSPAITFNNVFATGYNCFKVSLLCYNIAFQYFPECPESWTTISDSINSCYLANHIERYRRDSAALACRDEAPGAHLVMIET